MSLPILVSQDLWQEFDNAWKEHMASEEPIGDVVIALRVAGEKKRISRCLAMAKEHAEKLEGEGNPEDAARVLGAVLIAGGNPGELATGLLRNAEAAWGKEKWWPHYVELTGLVEGAPDLRTPWKKFSKACTFAEGSLVHHPGGWGTGEILELRPAELEVVVKFWNGRKDTFPLNAAIDIFIPLAEADLKARYFRDPEGMKKAAKKEPLEAMRIIALENHGTITTTTLRNALMQIGIEGSAWSAWWRKARKLAENSEWFEVTGSQAKSIIHLLLAAKDPSETLQRQLELAGNLADVLSKVRELFVGGKVDDKIKAVGVEMLAERAEIVEEHLLDRLAAWLLLRDVRGETPESMLAIAQELKNAEAPTDPSVPPMLWATFAALGSVRDQERSVGVMKELFGDGFLDEVGVNLTHAGAGMVRPMVEALTTAKRQADLRRHYSALLARPLRAPALLVTLARVFEDGKLDGEDLPKDTQRAHSLLHLASLLFEQRRGNAHLTRVHQRLVDLLTLGDPSLLKTLLADVDAAGLRSLLMLHARGIDDAIDHKLTDIALELDRDFFAAELGPFWVGNTIWTTKAGLEARSAELKELREVKIPENQDAIGRAASYGDLSENAEWEAAMEEMRNLTSRAMEMEEELREADLLDNAAFPENTVCPGMTVKYRETDTGEARAVTILGPWDGMHGEDVVSYRAPLAAGLCGLHPGDSAKITLPGGEVTVEVLSIAPAAGL
jgi:transcription elongation GreA/GreB family factor